MSSLTLTWGVFYVILTLIHVGCCISSIMLKYGANRPPNRQPVSTPGHFFLCRHFKNKRQYSKKFISKLLLVLSLYPIEQLYFRLSRTVHLCKVRSCLLVCLHGMLPVSDSRNLVPAVWNRHMVIFKLHQNPCFSYFHSAQFPPEGTPLNCAHCVSTTSFLRMEV